MFSLTSLITINLKLIINIVVRYIINIFIQCILHLFQAIALVSDLGGQAGLWLGVSVVAFFELFQLIFDIICLKVNHMKNKGNKHNQVDNYDEIKKSKVEPI